jgi:ribosome-associated protein
VISEILKSGKFSKLVIVPAGKPWQKSPSASANNRLEMTKLALSKIDVEVSDCEVKRDTPSYAIDTVHDLHSLNPESSLTWIIGSDAIAGLSTWNRIDEMASEVEFLIVLRPGHTVDQSAIPHFIKWTSIEIHARDISATQVREKVSVGSDISDLVEHTQIAARAAIEKLGTDLVAIDLSEQMLLSEVFLLISGQNERQIDAIADEVEKQLSLEGEKPLRREGSEHWILLDYEDLVVHVQTEEVRSYYMLDRLWNDCPNIPLEAVKARDAFEKGKA